MSLLSISYHLNKPLIELIQNDGALTYPFNKEKLGQSKNKRKVRTKEQHNIAERHLKALISDPPEPFPSLPMICNRLKCTPGYINYRFPDLRKVINTLYKDSLSEYSSKRLKEKKQAIVSAVKELQSQSRYPSYNALSKLLTANFSFFRY